MVVDNASYRFYDFVYSWNTTVDVWFEAKGESEISQLDFLPVQWWGVEPPASTFSVSGIQMLHFL